MRRNFAISSPAKWSGGPARRPTLAISLIEILDRLGLEHSDVLSTRVWIGGNRDTDPYRPADAISSGPAYGAEPGVICAITMSGAFLEIEAVKRARPANWP